MGGFDFIKVLDSNGNVVAYEPIANGGLHPDGLTGPTGDWFWVSEEDGWRFDQPNTTAVAEVKCNLPNCPHKND